MIKGGEQGVANRGEAETGNRGNEQERTTGVKQGWKMAEERG